MKKINLVVIGYGGMGSWHTRFAKESDCVNLAGVYDIKEEKNEAARKNGISLDKTPWVELGPFGPDFAV